MQIATAKIQPIANFNQPYNTIKYIYMSIFIPNIYPIAEKEMANLDLYHMHSGWSKLVYEFVVRV